VDIHPICPFLLHFFLQPIGICGFKGLNIIVPFAKIVKEFGTAKNLMKNMAIWQKAKIFFEGCFLRTWFLMLII